MALRGVGPAAQRLPGRRAGRRRPGAGGTGDEAATVDPASVVGAVGRWALTFHLVVLAWVFYRADALGTAGEILGRIVTVAPAGSVTVPALAVPLVVTAVAAQFVPADRTLGLRARFTTLAPVAQVAVLAAVLTVVSVLGPDGPLPASYLPF